MMTGHDPFSSRASTCSTQANENVDPEKTRQMASELIPLMEDEDDEVRQRATQSFYKLMAKKDRSGQSCLMELPYGEKKKLFEVLVAGVQRSVRALHQCPNQDKGRLETELHLILRILQYVGNIPKALEPFGELTEETGGRATHAIFQAIPAYKDGKPLDAEEQMKLIVIFLFLHSILESSEHCRRSCRHVPVVRKFMEILNRLLVPPRYVSLRLKKVIYACLRLIILRNEDLLKEAVNRGIVENLLKSLDDAVHPNVVSDPKASRHATALQLAVLESLVAIMKGSKNKGISDRAAFSEDVLGRFLRNDGFRKTARYIISVSPKTSESALLCLCYTAHLKELRNQNLRDPANYLLELLKRLTNDICNMRVDPEGKAQKKITGILNKALSPLASISQVKEVKEQLSQTDIVPTCLNCIEQVQKVNNSDVTEIIESCLIILTNLLNANNQHSAQVRAELLHAKNGPVVLLDQLSYGDLSNKKRAIKILCGLNEDVSALYSTFSSDGQWNFATALYYGIDKHSSSDEACTAHREHFGRRCPDQDEYLKFAFNFLRTLCMQSLEFASDFANYLKKRNIIEYLYRCTNEALHMPIVEFAQTIVSREPQIGIYLRSNDLFKNYLENRAKKQDALGIKCLELLGLLSQTFLSSELSNAIEFASFAE
uniref:Kinesin-associated protein n=1 Tax=Steinernema glaseri TaxID=37863 RepID=A0A1I7ZG58_9BILA